ncbi:MAG: septal ring lytic transglycosylase RlpA family protein [Candidatus Kapaibacterium sp.]
MKNSLYIIFFFLSQNIFSQTNDSLRTVVRKHCTIVTFDQVKKAFEYSKDSILIVPFDPDIVTIGEVSWYGPGFYGRMTANGEIFTAKDMTCAHKSLPFGSIIKVTDTKTGNVIVVRVNDRGPYVGSRVIDLSEAAMEAIGGKGRGTITAKLEIISRPEVTQSKKYIEISPFVYNIFTTIDGSANKPIVSGYTIYYSSFNNFKDAYEFLKEIDTSENKYFITQIRTPKRIDYAVLSGLTNTDKQLRKDIVPIWNEFHDAKIMYFEEGMLHESIPFKTKSAY